MSPLSTDVCNNSRVVQSSLSTVAHTSTNTTKQDTHLHYTSSLSITNATFSNQLISYLLTPSTSPNHWLVTCCSFMGVLSIFYTTEQHQIKLETKASFRAYWQDIATEHALRVWSL